MIKEIIAKYYIPLTEDKHHRYKSWEHCNYYFAKFKGDINDEENFDLACLHLAFYLASWGMLRGGAFLLQKDYRIHEYFIRDVATNEKYRKYYSLCKGVKLNYKDITGLDELIQETRRSYSDNISKINGIDREASLTDTLVSKILLGVFGIAPAYDRYFIRGIKAHGIFNTEFCEASIYDLFVFYNEYAEEFNDCAMTMYGLERYPPMKLLDMYFWQIGYMLENQNKFESKEISNISHFTGGYSSLLNQRVLNPSAIENINSETYKKAKQTDLKADILKYINDLLEEAQVKGINEVILSSGQVHKAMNLHNRIPSVCNAMVKIDTIKYEVIHDTPSGMSSTKTLKYYLTKSNE